MDSRQGETNRTKQTAKTPEQTSLQQEGNDNHNTTPDSEIHKSADKNIQNSNAFPIGRKIEWGPIIQRQSARAALRCTPESSTKQQTTNWPFLPLTENIEEENEETKV